MPNSLLTIALAAGLVPSANKIDCRATLNADWFGNEDPSAVVCNGVSGFFVPSAQYRALRKPEESDVYKLLEKELQLAKMEIDARKNAKQAAESAIDNYKAASEPLQKALDENL